MKKLECSKQACAVECVSMEQHDRTLVPFCWFAHHKAMLNRDSWGHSHSVVRGEILGFTEDELLRKHLPRMFSLIKNES